jgi:hypothetical protein
MGKKRNHFAHDSCKVPERLFTPLPRVLNNLLDFRAACGDTYLLKEDTAPNAVAQGE